MNEYGPELVALTRKSDHERIVTSGAWWGTLAVTLAMMWLTTVVPYAVAWLVNSVVTIGVSYAMARWKRAWYGWLAFWGIVAVCALNGLLKAATTLLDAPWSGVTWILAWLLASSWYWLVRAPRRQSPATPQVSHVVHHHVLHAPGGVTGTAIPAAEDPGWVSVPAASREAIPAAAMRAIGPTPSRPAASALRGALSGIRAYARRTH